MEDTMRLESQVERTLELARVEGGGPVFPEPMELKPWLDQTGERLARLLRRQGSHPGFGA